MTEVLIQTEEHRSWISSYTIRCYMYMSSCATDPSPSAWINHHHYHHHISTSAPVNHPSARQPSHCSSESFDSLEEAVCMEVQGAFLYILLSSLLHYSSICSFKVWDFKLVLKKYPFRQTGVSMKQLARSCRRDRDLVSHTAICSSLDC